MRKLVFVVVNAFTPRKLSEDLRKSELNSSIKTQLTLTIRKVIPGSIIFHIIEKLWIPKKYLQALAGHDFRYAALKVNGYSMEPLLAEGDIVVIDRAKRYAKTVSMQFGRMIYII